jgi:hypothetical protein
VGPATARKIEPLESRVRSDDRVAGPSRRPVLQWPGGLRPGNAKLQSLHHAPVFDPADVLLIVVAHSKDIGMIDDGREADATGVIAAPLFSASERLVTLDGDVAPIDR